MYISLFLFTYVGSNLNCAGLGQHPSCILFTVRTFINPFEELKEEPRAAQMLLHNLDRLEPTEFKRHSAFETSNDPKSWGSHLKILKTSQNIA